MAGPPFSAHSAGELDAAVRAVCPEIDGVSTDGTIFFQPGASQPNRVAALNAVQNFVPADPAIERARQASIKADAERIVMLTRLKNASPAQIDNWVQNNVTNFAQAQKAIAIILKVIALDGR